MINLIKHAIIPWLIQLNPIIVTYVSVVCKFYLSGIRLMIDKLISGCQTFLMGVTIPLWVGSGDETNISAAKLYKHTHMYYKVSHYITFNVSLHWLLSSKNTPYTSDVYHQMIVVTQA